MNYVIKKGDGYWRVGTGLTKHIEAAEVFTKTYAEAIALQCPVEAVPYDGQTYTRDTCIAEICRLTRLLEDIR